MFQSVVQKMKSLDSLESRANVTRNFPDFLKSKPPEYHADYGNRETFRGLV